MIEKLIITLTEHTVWGSILQPVLVSQDLSGYLTILEIVGSKSTFLSQLTSMEREIVMMSEKVSDKNLMKNYSKEKNLAEFFKRLAPETTERYIRPAIETYHRKVIEVLQQSDLSLYIRDGVKTRVLYDTDRVIVPDISSQVVFNFKKEAEKGLSYFISLKCGNDEFDLHSKTFFGLCTEPAVLVINHKLHSFTDIDIKKLIPFFTKWNIEVPPSAEKAYIRKFIKSCVEKYEVNSKGLDIQEVQPVRKAVLSLDADWSSTPALFLNFKYGTQLFPMDSPNRKNVYVEEEADSVSLRWFYPDKEWEAELTNKLIEAGLKKSGINQFSVNVDEEIVSDENLFSLIEWLQCHPDVLQYFDFKQNISDRHFFLDEIKVNLDIDSKQDWFDIHVMAVFGKFKIPFSRFRNHILNNLREYVLPDNSIAILPSEWFTRYYELMLFSKKTDQTIRLKKHHFAVVNQIQGKSVADLKAGYKDIGSLEIPSGLCAELRNYQIKGFGWLVHLYENNFGGCLADDMGLGKTLQTISLMLYVKEKNKIKTSTSKSLSLPRFLPPTKEAVQLTLFDEPETHTVENVAITPVQYSSTSLIVMPTSLIHNWLNEFKKFAPGLRIYVYSGVKRLKTKSIYKIFGMYDVVLTTYGILRNDIELLDTCLFHHLILDESQYVKNPDSLVYKAVKQINAQYKLALTGTPVENSLTDLWAQFNIVNEGLLGNQTSFRNAYINPISKNNKAKEEALLRIIQPFILRRTKDEVAPELPPLSQETVFCNMSEEQQKFYKQEKNKIRSSILLADPSTDLSKMAFMTLQGLTRLRLLANHPVLVNGDYSGDSGKMEQIIMRFETLKSESHKVLIFSSFVKHLRLLSEHFDKENWKYAWLSGSTPATSRETEIQKFKEDPDVNCFFISLKAGGVGLNLTAADYVFIIDPWWNPASEMQALSRSHRIGQQKNVMVYRFISSETIEEKIRNLQESKSKLAETFVTSSNPLKDMNKDEMVQLLD